MDQKALWLLLVPSPFLTGTSKLAMNAVCALVGLAFAASPPDGAAALSDAPPSFRDELRSGGFGPEMVAIPAGRFRMGCDRGEVGCTRERQPSREVVFGAPFAMSKHEVTFDDYDRFLLHARVGRRRHDEADDQGWGRGRRPVINVTWGDAVAYAAWLSAQTGARYRLPSEAEWEYAARAGATTKWPWGDEFEPGWGNCVDCGGPWQGERTVPVGMFPPNAWGLHDMQGNVNEILFDCFSVGYEDAPVDGSARTAPGSGRIGWFERAGKKDKDGECVLRTYHGGSWPYPASPPSRRGVIPRGTYGSLFGIRVARDLDDSGEDVADA